MSSSKGVGVILPWDEQNAWIPLPDLDARQAELLFRDKVLAFLSDRDLVDDERIALLPSWNENTGFSVDNCVVVPADDSAGLARLARYLMRSPVSLDRLTWDDRTGEVVYVAKRSQGHDDADSRREEPSPEERFDTLAFVARLLLHIAKPERHLIRYFGAYASVVRARQCPRTPADGLPTPASPQPVPSRDHPAPAPSEDPPPVKECRRRWADLIRRG